MDVLNPVPTVYLDLETTGFDPKKDEIVEVAILDEDGTVLLDTRVKPVSKEAWPQAQAIHGISPEDVQDAPPLEDISYLIQEVVYDANVVIYNAPFDTRFLPYQLDFAAAIKCCMKAFAKYYRQWQGVSGNQKLTTAAAYVNFTWPGEAHRAIYDCMATRAVWQYLTGAVQRPVDSERIKRIRQKRDLAWYTIRDLAEID